MTWGCQSMHVCLPNGLLRAHQRSCFGRHLHDAFEPWILWQNMGHKMLIFGAVIYDFLIHIPTVQAETSFETSQRWFYCNCHGSSIHLIQNRKNMLGTWGRLRFKILLKKPPFPTSREKTGNRPQLSGFSEFPKAQVRMLVKPLTFRQTNTAGRKIFIFPDKYHQNGGIFHGCISFLERTTILLFV